MIKNNLFTIKTFDRLPTGNAFFVHYPSIYTGFIKMLIKHRVNNLGEEHCTAEY